MKEMSQEAFESSVSIASTSVMANWITGTEELEGSVEMILDCLVLLDRVDDVVTI